VTIETDILHFDEVSCYFGHALLASVNSMITLVHEVLVYL